MARFAKPLQGHFSPAAKHSQKHKNRPKIGRFSHFKPSAEMHPFSPFSASQTSRKRLCDAICRKKQLFAGSFVSRSHSFCSFTTRIIEFLLSRKTILIRKISSLVLLKSGLKRCPQYMFSRNGKIPLPKQKMTCLLNCMDIRQAGLKLYGKCLKPIAEKTIENLEIS